MKTYLVLCLCLSALAYVGFCETQVCTTGSGTEIQQTTSWFANEQSILVEQLLDGIPVVPLVKVVHDYNNDRTYFRRFSTSECFATTTHLDLNPGYIYEIDVTDDSISPPPTSAAYSMCMDLTIPVAGTVELPISGDAPSGAPYYYFCDDYVFHFI
ncbi:uncharacterized protein LOC117114097 [Anneissia japonica]|uniref:uncharacterized protein LOC117114097 n=1 Tax=Anneissia japonica TaxID=1529436 RepID=UPI001425535A|nr:uncharacterized protein LOC117114097 [Anneissia japonica]XP_033113531.1 uncharacterized protein LOC117114097 [Anneissia japonica]